MINQTTEIENQGHFSISDKVYDELYETYPPGLELVDDPFFDTNPDDAGACKFNAQRTASYLITQGVPKENLQYLHIYAPTPIGPQSLHPNISTLRQEEQERGLEKKDGPQWMYHSAIVDKKTKRVFDLSSDKRNWGIGLEDYMTKTFLDENGKGNQHLRFIVTTLDALDKYAGKEIDTADELRKIGDNNGGGMSDIKSLKNKPESEWWY